MSSCASRTLPALPMALSLVRYPSIPPDDSEPPPGLLTDSRPSSPDRRLGQQRPPRTRKFVLVEKERDFVRDDRGSAPNLYLIRRQIFRQPPVMLTQAAILIPPIRPARMTIYFPRPRAFPKPGPQWGNLLSNLRNTASRFPTGGCIASFAMCRCSPWINWG